MQNTTNMQWGWNYKAMETFASGTVWFVNVGIYLWIASLHLISFSSPFPSSFLSSFLCFLPISLCLLPPPFFPSFFVFPENERQARNSKPLRVTIHYEATKDREESRKWEVDPKTQDWLLVGGNGQFCSWGTPPTSCSGSTRRDWLLQANRGLLVFFI